MDVYFRPEYAELCSLTDGGTAECFEYVCACGTVTHRFIKRQIPQPINGQTYYDLTTPYGYGGPLVHAKDPSCRQELISGFADAFARYCREERVVSEFVRFHPLCGNAQDMGEMYHPCAVRKTVGTDLENYEDPVQSEFSKTCRKNIRRALNAGMTFRVTRAPASIDRFTDIYYSTMRRDAAASYYYFDKAYFDRLLQLFRDDLLFTEVLYEDTVIAASLCFVSDDTVHIHLSGTLSEYLHLSPAYLLRYAVVQWGKENGMRWVHHGGGTTNAPDDSLFLFKKQFGKNTEFDFFIGKKIWDAPVYATLCEQTHHAEDTAFFPAYREGELA